MVNFLFSAYFGGHFCYHSNGKSQSNWRLLHIGYCSNKLIKTNWCFFLKIFSLIGGGGGQKSPLMHVALYNKLEMIFMKHYAPNPFLVMKDGSFFKTEWSSLV